MERLTKRKDLTACESCKEKYCTTCDEADKAIKKLADYEDLEKAGLLVRLPCKVGDKVYYVDECRKIIHERTVAGFEVVGDSVSILTDYGDVICKPDFLEKIAFLTRKEAEKRLKELKK